MFEAAEIGRKTSKAEYEAALPELRSRLLAAQRLLRDQNRTVIIILSGVEGAGKSEVVNRLHEWLDARGLVTQAFWRDSDEERERPRYWRFWRALPPRGTIGILFGSWYTHPIIDRAFGKNRRSDLDRELQRIVFFERMLVKDGAVIVKLWLHLPKDDAKRRRKKGSMYGGFTKMYDRFAAVSERAISSSDTAEAPWRIIEAADQRYRDLTIGRVVLEALESLGAPNAAPVAEAGESVVRTPKKAAQTALDRIDLTKTITAKKYERDLEKLQADVAKLAWKAWDKRRSTVIVFEGWDAAGKGGAIRRLIAPIDARLYRVISVAAPTDEERAHHYLWRFWRQLPRDGAMTLYDRSWYGRVLVERVEGFARNDEWSRAYREINDFEEQLVEHGIVLIKFWLHISKAEQLRRFKERQKIAFKQHKITDEDWRNREKWKPYELAVNDMIERTSSEMAPWTVIPANDKRLARLHVLETVVQALR
jgi:AMP-polyphosphate phosphotransferase